MLQVGPGGWCCVCGGGDWWRGEGGADGAADGCRVRPVQVARLVVVWGDENALRLIAWHKERAVGGGGAFFGKSASKGSTSSRSPCNV